MYSVPAVNPAAEGTVYPSRTFEVTQERVAAFRDVFGQSEGIPPTFATAAEFVVFPFVLEDPNLALDFTRVVHGSQEYEHRRPLREGETLTVTVRLDSIKVKGTNAFLTLVTDLVGEDGQLACVATSTMIERGAA